MAQIFLSYASADRDRVLPLVEALQDDGFTVWWDRDIRPGPNFDREIEQAIDAAACMVVVWSSNSVESEWVRSEVEEGVRRNILIPVMIEPVMPPLAYRRRQSANLSDWRGELDGDYEKLLTGIRATLEGKSLDDKSAEAKGADGAPDGLNTDRGAALSAPTASNSVSPTRRRRRRDYCCGGNCCDYYRCCRDGWWLAALRAARQ
jgi:hypothetical protein